MNKILISLAIIGIVAGISLGVTGAWWNSTAVSHNASFTSGTLQLKLANSWNGNLKDRITETWDQSNMEPGGTPLDKTLYMKNVGSIDAHRMSFAVTTTTNPTNLNMAAQMRITKLDYGAYEGNGNWGNQNLLTGGAGADLSNYVAPTYCNVTVDPSPNGTYKTIHAGVAAAKKGDVVCVEPGDYKSSWETNHSSSDYPVAINKGITLVSLKGPTNTTITVANGTNAINVAADNVTIKGFTITGAAYGINTGGHTGITVTDNKIVNYSQEGIWIDGGSATIANNVIKANDNGMPNNDYSVDSIYIKNGAVATIDHNNLENNKYGGTIYNGNNWSTAVGIAAHTGSDVTATYNVITGNDFGIQIKERGVTMTANYNDILGNTRDFFFEAYNGCAPVKIFDVTNNWWGDFNPADQVSVDPKCTNPISDIVHYAPYAGGPFIGFINGVDSNGNGYADLNDFYLQRTQGLNVNSGLNAGQWGKLEMAVQLDGPTTGNSYQGKTLGMDMIVNMYQH